MKLMTQFGAAAVLAAGVMAASVGCQNAGRQDDTGRPARVSATYDRAYVASRDTEWVPAPGGTPHVISRGTRVWFANAPTTDPWQQARLEGPGVVYVRPA